MISGDKVGVDWETSGGAQVYMWDCPVGTNDFNFNDGNACNEYSLNANFKAANIWTAPRTGESCRVS